MKIQIAAALALCLILAPFSAHGLSRAIARDIEFPKHYPPEQAAAIRKVIQDERFKFVGGVVSYWPPDWGTQLSYEGDAHALNEFVSQLRQLRGIGLRLALYSGRSDELRQDSSWQLYFSHAYTNRLTLHLNLNSPGLDFSKIELPEWPAP